MFYVCFSLSRNRNFTKVSIFYNFVVINCLQMTKKDKILAVLDGVVHPETGQGLAAGGFVESVSAEEHGIAVELRFRRARDPFAASLRRQAATALSEAFKEFDVTVDIWSPAVEPEPAPSRRLPGVKFVVAVSSGKGGVGKSTVAAYLAAVLAAEGYRVGILDADIYGPSQPALFGMEGYLPAAEGDGVNAAIVPAVSSGVKIMSIGFFIAPSDALVWRGPMATNALRQLIRQTAWGELDYLFVDLPPGTGDVHLSIVRELDLDGAVIVSTPGSLSLADVRRGVKMFRTEGMEAPVLGVVENMAWFTPAELPDNRYFIFGKDGTRKFAAEENIDFLGEIPIILSVMESGEKGLPAHGINTGAKPYYESVARRIVDKLSGECR